MGTCFNYSIAQFNDVLGFFDPFYEDLFCDFCEDFNPTIVYDELYDNLPDTYDPNNSKDLFLQEVSMKYIHKFLAYSFSGWKDASCPK